MNIEIPSDCEKIHVLFSGGADSSLLLYLLTEQICVQGRTDIPIVANSFYGNTNITSKHNVLNYIQNKFNINIQYRHNKLRYNIRDFVKFILETDPGYVYSGCNKVLTEEFTPTIYLADDTPPVRGPAFNERHIRPFIFLDKSEILNVYVEKNILDLFRMTYSCGKLEKKCGGCYFCMERSWAVEKVGIRD